MQLGPLSLKQYIAVILCPWSYFYCFQKHSIVTRSLGFKGPAKPSWAISVITRSWEDAKGSFMEAVEETKIIGGRLRIVRADVGAVTGQVIIFVKVGLPLSREINNSMKRQGRWKILGF